MIVVTLLTTESQVRRVIQALPPPHRLVQASGVVGARVILRDQSADVIVVDPVVGDRLPRIAATVPELFDLTSEFPYLPILFYVSNPIASLAILAHLPTRESCEAIVMGVDDGPRAIREAIASVTGASLVARLIRHITPALTSAPSSLQSSVRQVLTMPHAFDGGEQLAKAACMSRRTLDRWLARCGVVASAEFVTLARAFLAVRLTRDMSLERETIRHRCGITKTDNLEGFVARNLGRDLLELAALPDAELLEAFHQRLLRRDQFVITGTHRALRLANRPR